jgi:hypothetical protein
MKAFNGFSFAMGIAFCLALVGCMMAVTNVNNSAGARYEVHWQDPGTYNGTSSYYVVLDTTTGTTVTWSSTPPGEVRAFAAAP